ncbi:hypothetical protein TWF506_004641 [Arthrobotrys conoides]|uniref:Uncharacterized protein n=1 Tax=Arthrobotrys conoides TaxID=74498 RepID=A0AAN8RT60_9PEZI
MEDNHQWAPELEYFNCEISQPRAASNSSYQDAICAPQVPLVDPVEMNWHGPDPRSAIDETDPNFDVEIFLRESYDVLGLRPREEDIHTTDFHDLVTLEGLSSIPNQTLNSQAGSQGEAIIAIPQLTDALKSLKIVQRNKGKGRGSGNTKYQAKIWNDEPYTNIFRIEKQKKRPRTKEEKANKRLITKFGPCIPCFQSKTKCNYNVKNPNECCVACQRRKMSSSLSTYRFPCVRIYLNEDFWRFSGELPAALAGSQAELISAIEQLANLDCIRKRNFYSVEFERYKSCESGGSYSPVISGGTILRTISRRTIKIRSSFYAPPRCLLLLLTISPKFFNIILKRFWRDQLSREDISLIVDTVDILEDFLASIMGNTESLVGLRVPMLPIDLYSHHVLICNVLTPLTTMAKLARERFSLKPVPSGVVAQDVGKAIHLPNQFLLFG